MPKSDWTEGVKVPQWRGIPDAFQNYQSEAHTFAFPNLDYAYFSSKLAEEVGEVSSVLNKYKYNGTRVWQKNGQEMEFFEALEDELGDVLWVLTECCQYFGLSLTTVARKNIEKLTERREKHLAKGKSGD